MDGKGDNLGPEIHKQDLELLVSQKPRAINKYSVQVTKACIWIRKCQTKMASPLLQGTYGGRPWPSRDCGCQWFCCLSDVNSCFPCLHSPVEPCQVFRSRNTDHRQTKSVTHREARNSPPSSAVLFCPDILLHHEQDDEKSGRRSTEGGRVP